MGFGFGLSLGRTVKQTSGFGGRRRDVKKAKAARAARKKNR